VLAVSLFAAWRAMASGAERLEPLAHVAAKKSPLAGRIVRCYWGCQKHM
jgi:hypothetical protein